MDKRRHPRVTLGDRGWRAELVDQVSEAVLGTVVNLSQDGMMLITSADIGIESLHQVDCVATGPERQRARFSAGVIVLWLAEASQENTFWAGLKIIDIDESSRSQLIALGLAMATDD